ncbi:hypothetical protein ACROYT_G004908 [Oculina patagonica]
MGAKCSFSAIVGDSCTYERRDKAKKTEVIPLLYCTREIAGHKSTWGISDVETEVDLILARAAVFSFPQNIGQFTICPYHRSSLGTGWRRGSQRCQVPEKLSGHSKDRRWPKAERGLGKRAAKLIIREQEYLLPSDQVFVVTVVFYFQNWIVKQNLQQKAERHLLKSLVTKQKCSSPWRILP